MGPETRNCQNCQRGFAIDPENFSFYERIKVPPPTFCPPCRFQRRLLFWNAINLYKRPCDLCHSFNVSVYAPEAPYTVYCPKCWWSDDWDARDYGQDYDFSRPFFEQLNEFWHKVPLIGLSTDLTAIETCPYNHDSGHVKNCYLIFHGETVEDSAYGYFVGYSQSMLDCSAVEQSQSCYDSMHCYRANHCVGIRDQISESVNCLFCRDSQNCQDCFASANLRNKKYYAWNKPLSKEEYQKEISKYDLGSYKVYRELQTRAQDFWKTQVPKSEYNEFAVNCTGSNIFRSKNVKDAIETYDTEDSRYIFRVWGPGNKNCHDISMWGVNLSNSYENIVVGDHSTGMLFCNEAGLGSSDVRYSKTSISGSHNFACVSLRKGNNMIFNKQYSPEEYLKMVEKIKKHMDEMPYIDKAGRIYRYGEFFPPEMSPFAYNETLASNLFPMDKEGIERAGYRFREVKQEDAIATMSYEELPDHIKDAPDSVLNERISCEQCSRTFRLIEMELSFLRRQNLPLPRRCPFCRIDEKLNIWVKDNRRILRICADCGKNMESKYSEQDAEDVFCRACYLKKID